MPSKQLPEIARTYSAMRSDALSGSTATEGILAASLQLNPPAGTERELENSGGAFFTARACLG